MNFIKRNKSIIIAIVIFLILVLVLFQLKTIFFPNTGKAIYGNRLDGIENVKISSETFNNVKSMLEGEGVSNVSTRLSGKLVKIFITANDEVDVETAKTYGSKVLEAFSEAEKKYYDFQIYIQKTGESTQFPIVGYKHHNKESISWTKDR